MELGEWYFDCLLFADDRRLVRGFRNGKPSLDDPLAGRIEERTALASFAADKARWMVQHKARVEAVGHIATAERLVSEVVLHLELPRGPWALPVALAADRDVTGLKALRIYHALWPLIGGHRVRPPLLHCGGEAELAGAVAGYQRALAAGDLEGILDSFEPDATVREPSGGPYRYQGAERIRELYGRMFASGGGIRLEHCTATDDGRACAIEYVCVGWGAASLQPQAGIAVYARGPSGRLAAARIYDDVEPPASSDTSLALT